MQIRDLIDIFHLPPATINLRLEETSKNDPFYAQVVKSYYAEAKSRHSKYLFVEKYKYGFALCKLPADFDSYFNMLESPARGNYRKALKLGYEMRRFDFNSHIDDIREIWQSTPVRQGPLPEEIREGRVTSITNPPTRTTYHDYPYFGVFKGEKLVAYAGLLVAGDICNLADFYGHDDYLKDSIVPLLIIEIARELYKSYPAVRIYSYGTYFGASKSMRRFKRKFLFYPHKVNWILSTPLKPTVPGNERLIYRLDISAPLPSENFPEGSFITDANLRSISAHFFIWVKTWGWKVALKTLIKVLSGKRILFGVIRDKKVIQFGWLNLGKCRFYRVEQGTAVVETLWTDPQYRGHGLASATIRKGLVYLSQHGYRRFYVDTILANHPSQRMIEKAGFSERVAC